MLCITTYSNINRFTPQTDLDLIGGFHVRVIELFKAAIIITNKQADILSKLGKS